ncbi:MAG TPA: NAD(P)H-dependent oxidoreductase [Armatimonadota bacterium]|jgi:FMN reductase
MSGKVKIVGLGGSLDGSSSSLAALKVALEASAISGAEVQLLDIHALALPMFEPRLSKEKNVCDFCEAVYEADGMLWCSPLYHGTISGAFKNALDWLELLGKRQPAYLTDKVIGLISTAGGTQGLQAINTMEYIVRALRGWTVPLVVPVPRAWQNFDKEGHPLDETIERQLQALGDEVVRAAGIFAAQRMTTVAAQAAEAALNPSEG